MLVLLTGTPFSVNSKSMVVSYFSHCYYSAAFPFWSYWWHALESTCSPFQKLELKCANEGRSGFSFSSYELQWDKNKKLMRPPATRIWRLWSGRFRHQLLQTGDFSIVHPYKDSKSPMHVYVLMSPLMTLMRYTLTYISYIYLKSTF